MTYTYTLAPPTTADLARSAHDARQWAVHDHDEQTDTDLLTHADVRAWLRDNMLSRAEARALLAQRVGDEMIYTGGAGPSVSIRRIH